MSDSTPETPQDKTPEAESSPPPGPSAAELARVVDALRLELARAGRREFESYQQRARREADAERRYAQMPLAKDLLPVIDNLERAVAAARQAHDGSSLAQGVGMVVGMLHEALRRHGIVRIEAENQPFDANLHEAVMQQPNAEVPANTVLQVLESGYLIHERVLRPARVIVSTN